MNSSGGGGAARPPPSASMGKLSLEDEAARKGNANGPSGKNLNQFEGWNAESTQDSTLGMECTSSHRCIFTEQALCNLSSHPILRGGDRTVDAETSSTLTVVG